MARSVVEWFVVAQRSSAPDGVAFNGHLRVLVVGLERCTHVPETPNLATCFASFQELVRA
eukprot:1525687-Pyramimonas_sp.AAC.1